jgi:hypothetical protein
MKKNKTVKKFIKWFLVFILSAIIFFIIHELATLERGYKAMGGELFMLMIPFFVWLSPEIKKSIKEIKDELSR